jgi:hypothetical protein
MCIVWRLASPNQKGSTAWVGFVLLSGILLISMVMHPFRESPFPLCLLHLALGIAGPGCGMTRAFLFLGHGDIWSALELNPNSPLVFGLVLALWGNHGLRLFWGHEVRVVLSRRAARTIYLGAAALAAFAWLYNLFWNPWA